MKEKIHNSHDIGFKYLFGIKRLFVQLMRSFLEEGWAQRIETENVEIIDKSFILPDFKEKEADLVYKVKMDGREVYFYFLLELQSKVDYQMPYRLLLYMVEIWRTVIKDMDQRQSKSKEFKLPVIIPCVLYNGNNKWTAKISFRESLESEKEFGEYVLDFKYILFDVKRYSDEDLLKMANVIGSVFFVDKNTTKGEELLKRLKTMTKSIKSLHDDDMDVLWAWIKNIVTKGNPKAMDKELEDIFQKGRQVKDMEHAIEKILRKEIREAKAEGKAEGEAKVKIEIVKNLIQEGAECRTAQYNRVKKQIIFS